MTDDRANEFLSCLGNGKTIYEIESDEEDNEDNFKVVRFINNELHKIK